MQEIARRTPELVVPIVQALRADADLYVRRSVANVLRNAGNYHPDFVLKLAEEWASAAATNPHTAWILRDGLRKIRPR